VTDHETPSPRSGDLLLITGATGLVGRLVVERALTDGWRVRALVRDAASARDLSESGAELAGGSMTDATELAAASVNVTHVVHAAAKVGDWGPAAGFRAVNVEGLRTLIDALRESGRLRRFVQVSSLGVYPARDHYGTDESTQPHATGIDGYTLSKIEAEQLLQEAVREHQFPAVIVRPGFIYGPGDRSVLPRLVERLQSGQFAYLGDRTRLMNNTAARNLVDAIFLLLNREDLAGEVFNITDGRLVTKEEFVSTVARGLGIDPPTRAIPLGIAKALAAVLETLWRWRGKPQAPILSRARIKFLGLNLDFSIDKARHVLGYNPRYDFTEAMTEAAEWIRDENRT
jgi:2-alkyl-3-oxoalkanoate reductase